MVALLTAARRVSRVRGLGREARTAFGTDSPALAAPAPVLGSQERDNCDKLAPSVRSDGPVRMTDSKSGDMAHVPWTALPAAGRRCLQSLTAVSRPAPSRKPASNLIVRNAQPRPARLVLRRRPGHGSHRLLPRRPAPRRPGRRRPRQRRAPRRGTRDPDLTPTSSCPWTSRSRRLPGLRLHAVSRTTSRSPTDTRSVDRDRRASVRTDPPAVVTVTAAFDRREGWARSHHYDDRATPTRWLPLFPGRLPSATRTASCPSAPAYSARRTSSRSDAARGAPASASTP